MVGELLNHVSAWLLLLLGLRVAVSKLNRTHDLGHVDLLSLDAQLAQSSLLAACAGAAGVEFLVDQLLAGAAQVVLLALVEVLLDVHLHVAAADQFVRNLQLLCTDIVLLLLLTLARVFAGPVLAVVAQPHLAGRGLFIGAEFVDVG